MPEACADIKATVPHMFQYVGSRGIVLELHINCSLGLTAAGLLDAGRSWKICVFTTHCLGQPKSILKDSLHMYCLDLEKNNDAKVKNCTNFTKLNVV